MILKIECLFLEDQVKTLVKKITMIYGNLILLHLHLKRFYKEKVEAMLDLRHRDLKECMDIQLIILNILFMYLGGLMDLNTLKIYLNTI